MTVETLEGDRVVVIGGSSGIGLAIAEAAAAAGADVVIGSRDDESRREAATAIGDAASEHPVDLAEPASIDRFLDAVGTLDHLVLTAAYIPTGGFREATGEEVARALEVKARGYFEAASRAEDHIADGGTMTAISALSADRPSADYFALGMANAAVEVLMRSVALELGPVRANVISPSTVDTWGMDAERKARMAEGLPAGHVGEPQDIADAAVFCMTNPYLSGETLRIDGGERLT